MTKHCLKTEILAWRLDDDDDDLIILMWRAVSSIILESVWSLINLFCYLFLGVGWWEIWFCLQHPAARLWERVLRPCLPYLSCSLLVPSDYCCGDAETALPWSCPSCDPYWEEGVLLQWVQYENRTGKFLIYHFSLLLCCSATEILITPVGFQLLKKKRVEVEV